MLERFGALCDLAEKYDIKLIVGILTGWMSGRAFILPVLYGKNPATDPVALMFEQKFVRGIVKSFKDKKAIYAWDLGNECNSLARTNVPEETDSWAMLIANAIKAADSSFPSAVCDAVCLVTSNGEQWVTLINYSPVDRKINMKIKDGYEYEIIKGNTDEIEPFEMALIKIKKK